MFPRVLVATDFSADADSVLGCIGEIPGMREILLVHVLRRPGRARPPVAGTQQPSPEDQALAALDAKRALLESLDGVTVGRRIAHAPRGDIPGAILRVAREEKITLIVMGGRGRGILAGFFLGSVSEGVIQRSITDVLIMHVRGGNGHGTAGSGKYCRGLFSHVLCPVDFSRPSQKTLDYALDLGPVRRITLLHVMDPAIPPPERDRLEGENRQRLEAMAAGLSARGIRAASLIRDGSPAEEIVRAAVDLDVSLILIARRGLSDYLGNVPIGRVAGGVAARAQCPFFIVNPYISLDIRVRELGKHELSIAEDLWLTYHQQTADPATDRVFVVFAEGHPVAAARCRRHPGGLEVDAVFVPEEYRGMGYARLAVEALVDSCGNEPLFMHATLGLTGFYGTFGFSPIPEHALPPAIRDRFSFANGDLEGSNVQPMSRPAGNGRGHGS